MDITFGTLPPEQWAVVEKLIDPEPSAFVFRTGTEGGMLRCGYAALPDDALRIAELMREYGFQPVEPPRVGFNGVPARRIEELRGAAAAARESAERLNREVEALKADIREELLRRYSYLRYHSEAHALRTYAGTDGRRFCLMGWIPEADKDGFAAEARRMGCTCDFERPGQPSTPPRHLSSLRRFFFSNLPPDSLKCTVTPSTVRQTPASSC